MCGGAEGGSRYFGCIDGFAVQASGAGGSCRVAIREAGVLLEVEEKLVAMPGREELALAANWDELYVL